jgi:hypothetical protein
VYRTHKIDIGVNFDFLGKHLKTVGLLNFLDKYFTLLYALILRQKKKIRKANYKKEKKL